MKEEDHQEKPQRILKCRVLSLDAISAHVGDHYRSTPLWENDPSDPELREIIFKEIARLTSPKQARVLKLRWFGEVFIKDLVRFGFKRSENKAATSRGLTAWEELAKRLGKSRQNLKKIETRALKRLRESEVLKAYVKEKYQDGKARESAEN